MEASAPGYRGGQDIVLPDGRLRPATGVTGKERALGKDLKIALTVGILVTLIVGVVWLVKDNAGDLSDLASPERLAAPQEAPQESAVDTRRPSAPAPSAPGAPEPRRVYAPQPARQVARNTLNTLRDAATPDDERLVVEIGMAQRPPQETSLPEVGRSRTRFDAVEQSPVSDTPAAAPVRTAPSRKTYAVVANDSLRKISRKVYGQERHWKRIQQANRERFPGGSTVIQVGWKLRIPPLAVREPSTRVSEARTVRAALSSPPAAGSARVHVVTARQTLYQIARKYYNNGNKWRVIWNANKEKIPNPDTVPVGVALTIPAI